ncbi:MAG: hypothetical protein ABI425_03065 [Patescibacteria group bacterium]
MKKILTSAGTVATLFALTVNNAFAADKVPPFTAPNSNSAGFQINDLGALIQGLLNGVMFVAAILVFAYMIWGGIQWITSGGDKGKTEEARNKITAAIVGLAILAASYAIFRVVLYFLGIANPFDSGVNPIPSVLQIQGAAGGKSL